MGVQSHQPYSLSLRFPSIAANAVTELTITSSK